MQGERKRLLNCVNLFLHFTVVLIWGLSPLVALAQQYPGDENTDTRDTLNFQTASQFQSATNPSDSTETCPSSPELDNALDNTSSEFGDLQRLPLVTPPKDAGADNGAGKGFGGGFGVGPGMGPGMGNHGPVSYETIWFPSVPVKRQPSDWGLVGQNFSLMYPLWVDLPNALMITGGVNNRLIDTGAILPDSRQPYPDNLWNVRLGMMYMRQLDAGRMFSFGVNVGSASDRPFASIREMDVSVMAMYRRPSGERNAWTFGLMYSPMGEIQFPMPMISFNWNPSDKFNANLGLPFMFNYRPNDRWTFEASYMPIHTINAKCGYRLSDKLRIAGGYSWSNEVYMLYDRTDNSDRFFLYDQRVTLGLESPIASWLNVELTGGYAFNRYSYTGRQWDSVQYDRVDIDNGPFLMLRACFRH
jgi:hypothetical protein